MEYFDLPVALVLTGLTLLGLSLVWPSLMWASGGMLIMAITVMILNITFGW